MKQRWGGRLRSRREAFSTRSLVKEVVRRLCSSGKEMVKSRPQACREQRGALQGGPWGPSSQMQLRGATSNGGPAGERRLPCSALLGPPGLPARERGPHSFPLVHGDTCWPETPGGGGEPGFKSSPSQLAEG